MKLKLDHESRVPLRAAVAVALALATGKLADAHFRGYWAVMVAAVLVTGTWGEGTKRGLTRFVMTAVGAAAGWDLHVLFGGHQTTRFAVMLFSIFWAVYFRGARYSWFTFFITIYVVFLFDVLEIPTGFITVLRVYQTFIGCGLALAAALFVPMPRSSEQWEADAGAFVRSSRAAADRSHARFSQLIRAGAGDAGATAGAAGAGIIPLFNKMRDEFVSARYEYLLDRAAHRRRKAFMDRARELAQATVALDHVASISVASDELVQFGEDLEGLRGRVAGRDRTDESLPPAANAFEAFRFRLDEGRREGQLSVAGFLVLRAVVQFSLDVARLADELERNVGTKPSEE